MLAVIGTLPEPDLPLCQGPVRLREDILELAGRAFPVQRGTAALLAAAWQTAVFLEQPEPYAILAGDIGLGDGSRRVYDFLRQHVGEHRFRVLCFHYLQPEVDWHQLVFWALEALSPRPLLIADAGFMYVAKMSGLAPHYDLFTPDVGELAFLADDQAPHPFYTRGFILQQEDRVPELIARAYEHQNAAKYLLVKGRCDYLASAGGILATVAEPQVEALEAIGGTGDTLTGMAAALAATGYSVPQAALLAAQANRWAGALASPTPAAPISQLLPQIPKALKIVLPDEARHG